MSDQPRQPNNLQGLFKFALEGSVFYEFPGIS